MGSSLSLVLIERPAHVRGGCTPGNSRRVAARDKSRLWQLASLVLIEKIAHVRGGGCKGAAGTLPPPLTNATERDTIEIEKESLPVRRLAQFMYYLRSSRNPWTGAATFSCF